MPSFPFSFWKIPTGGGGPVTPTLLFDSFNNTGAGDWTFDNGNVSETYAGQRSIVIPLAITIHRVDIKITGSFWAGYTNYKLGFYPLSGSDIVVGSPIGLSDEVSGDSSWAAQVVPFAFATPLAVSPQTLAFALGASSRKVGYAGSGSGASMKYTTGASLSGQMVSYSDTGVVKYDTTFPAYDLQMQIFGTAP